MISFLEVHLQVMLDVLVTLIQSDVKVLNFLMTLILLMGFMVNFHEIALVVRH